MTVLVVAVAAAVWAGVANADNAVVVDDNTTTSTDTSPTTDPAGDSTATDPSTDPSGSTTDPTGTPAEPPANPTPTDPPADGSGTGDPTAPPPGDTPPPDTVGSGDGTGASDGGTPPVTDPPPVDTPPVIDPVPPVIDDPSTRPPGDGNSQAPATPPFTGGGGADVGLPTGVQTAAPLSLDLLKIGGAASTKGRDPHLSNNGTRSTKEQSARRSLPSEGSPASSPSSAASGASGSSGGGGGVALAVEFLLAALVVLRYTRKAAFTLPDSLAFALREERPG